MTAEKKTVLVADDSKTFQMFLNILLKRMGFYVVTADDGQEAVRLARLVGPDLVTLDMEMPRMTGVEALASIRRDEMLRDIPVVIISANSRDDIAGRCKGLGCYSYIGKPLSVAELHRTVQELLFASSGRDRKYLRINVDMEASLRHNGYAGRHVVETLSERGAYIRMDSPPPVGSDVDVTLTLGGKPMDLKGTVIYAKLPHEDSPGAATGIAVEFRDLGFREAAVLNDYIVGVLTEGI